MTHFRLDVTITPITSITSGFWPDVTLDGSLPGGHPKRPRRPRRRRPRRRLRRRHAGGEAVVAERVAPETDNLQRGPPPQGRREGRQRRVADGGATQREALEPRQGASVQGLSLIHI